MSSKAKKTAYSKSNAIVTRPKSVRQTRRLRAKKKNTDEPIVTKPTIEKPTSEKPEIKSTEVTTSDNSCKDTPLRNKVRHLVQLVEQVEYYPDKLKRDAPVKKIMLKPKHNFKVVATANKRKLCVPQKGGTISPQLVKKRRSSTKQSEVSMVDMVRLIEDTQALSDEDLMEILTCPSPVWWEDPPDHRYIEDAICKRAPSQSSHISISTDENSRTEEPGDKRTNTPINTTKNKPLLDFENEIELFKMTTQSETNDEIKTKKQKLENILGNIKSKNKVETKNVIKTNDNKTTEIKISDIKTNKIQISEAKANELKAVEPKIKNKINESETKANEIKSSTIKTTKKVVKANEMKPRNIKTNKIKTSVIKRNRIKKNVEKKSHRRRRVSTSTDGGDLSDLSFNEEDILKNLENIEIPIEQNLEQPKANLEQNKAIGKLNIDVPLAAVKIRNVIRKKIIQVPTKKAPPMPRISVKKFATEPKINDFVIPDKMPSLTRKPDLKIDNADSKSDYLQNTSHSNLKFITDDDHSLQEENEETMDEMQDVQNFGESSSYLDIDTPNSSIKKHDINNGEIDTANTTGNNNNKPFYRKKVVKDLSEYITVYKIMSHENETNSLDSDKINKNSDNSSNNNVTGKLNNFFKKCKSNMRFKKSDSSFPGNTVTAIKDSTDNIKSDAKTGVSNDDNRLNPWDYCVVETENGILYACDFCNFRADSKDIYKKHLPKCKKETRIQWHHTDPLSIY